MQLSEVWMSYCADRFPEEKELPPPMPVDPWEALELLFELHPMFTARYDAIKSAPFDRIHDEETDGALCQLAMTDSFAGWDGLSAGGWRVMIERLIWSETVIAANAAQNNPVIAHLPEGLDRMSSAKALLLMYLLGGGRDVDTRTLDARPRGTFPSLPAQRPIRKQ
ncbi:hypothetical protein RA27_20370 [Ruegeria sp. ANG-R]|uniref:hypothetical protein n=1 Tax=Ruegeria sp. ANG-R TaxID=1577903 RepID=UPI00057DFDF6|nr:hypothetical protein [Ruegeria sp. ANG-R]KIC38129.1 hypothetical protein RA27_20370 [Ruegeria sp. ANG-R]